MGGGGGGALSCIYYTVYGDNTIYVMLKVWGRTRRIIGGGVLISTLTCTQQVEVSLTCLVPLVPVSAGPRLFFICRLRQDS